jgi:formate dehydrogenase subunit beta
MIDKRKIALETDGEILSVAEAGDRITVTTAAGETTYAKAEVLQSNCSVCQHRNPVIHDEMVADPVQEQTDVDPMRMSKPSRPWTPKKNGNFFEDLLSPCIRCYACRNACPLCYCPTCFVDESKPQWVGKARTVGRAHLSFLRAYHCAGRCTDCGACERACPVGINMRTLLTKKLKRTARKQYGWEAGPVLDSRPALDVTIPTIPENLLNKHA